MKAFLTSIIVSVIIAGSISLFILSHETKQNFGATANAGANALFEQSLAQPLGTADANMYITSGADVQGNLLPLNSYQCLSVDTGQPNFETVCGNVTASATSGLTLNITLRGLSTQTATTSNASFIFTHRRGADVRITDFPTLTVVNNELNGIQNIPNPIFYSSNFTTGYWATAPSSTLVTLGQAAAIAASGCGNASESVSGCSQLATAAQVFSSASTGSTGSRLVVPASLATSTPYNGGSSVIPSTGTNEKISQLFIDLTQSFSWSGLHNFLAGFLSTASSTLSATTSIAASNVNSNAFILNKIPYAWPSAQGGQSSILKDDGAGNLSWGGASHYSIIDTSTVQGGTTPATSTAVLSIPAGALSASSTISVVANVACNSTSSVCTFSLRDSGGTTFASCTVTNTAASFSWNGPLNITVQNLTGLSSQTSITSGILAITGTNTYAASDICSSTGSSSFNMANALNLVMVASGTNGSGVTSIFSYSIVVNP